MSSLETILGTSLANVNHLLSDKSQYGNVYLYNHNGIRFVLKVSVLTDDESLDDPILPIPYEYTEEGNNFSIQKRIDLYSNFNKEAKTQNNVYQKSYKKPLCPKLIDFYSIDNFGDQIAFLVKLQQISDEKSKNTIDNLLKNIYFKYEKNIYFKYEKNNKLGVIAMEYTDGYIPLSSFIKTLIDNEKKEIYENIICNAIRLLNETNQIHCDLNYGNIMVKDINDILFLDFARMEQHKMEFKQNFTKEDIENIVGKIIEIDENYQKKIDALHDNVFGTTIIDELDKLDSEKNYYANIAEKLNTFYVNNPTNNNAINKIHEINVNIGDISSHVDQTAVNNKLNVIASYIRDNRSRFGVSPPKKRKLGSRSFEYNTNIGDISSHVDQTAVNNKLNVIASYIRDNRSRFGVSPPKKRKLGSRSFEYNTNIGNRLNLPHSPETNRGIGLFGVPSPESSNENMPPNLFSFNLGTPPRTPGGAKKSKKQKRKSLHNKRKSKTHKNKSNKKRVKLISNK